MAGRAGGGLLFMLAAAGLLSGCGDDGKEPAMDQRATIAVSSAAFDDGERVPKRHTCDGANVSPPLAWSGVPKSAVALALVLDDPDAPRGTFTHWVILDIPTDVDAVPEGGTPSGGLEVVNSAGRSNYFGPCPPGGTHHYRFTVYALSGPTGLGPDASLAEALRAVEDRMVAWGRLTGTYSR